MRAETAWSESWWNRGFVSGYQGGPAARLELPFLFFSGPIMDKLAGIPGFLAGGGIAPTLKLLRFWLSSLCFCLVLIRVW